MKDVGRWYTNHGHNLLEDIVIALFIAKLAGVHPDYDQTLGYIFLQLVESRENVHAVYTAVCEEI